MRAASPVQDLHLTHAHHCTTHLSVLASHHAALYVIVSPTGSYIRDAEGRGIPLLATSDQVYAWPCGTSGFKFGLNCVPGFVAQRSAAVLGYEQLFWLLGGTVVEVGTMNVFAVFERTDGGELALGRLLLPSDFVTSTP